MNISLRWLEAFLRRPLDARDAADRLTMLGAPVDAVEPLHTDLGELVIGLVEEVRQHPNADRLRVCTVNDGTTERRTVVCGAPNVTAGRKYPFARVGTTVPHGKGGAPMKIERAKLRGEVSEGMRCSARELGLGQEHDGILELDTEAAPGTPLLEAVPLADHRLVVVAPAEVDFSKPEHFDTVKAFELPQYACVHLHRGTWHWGPYPVGADEVLVFNIQARGWPTDNTVAELTGDHGVIYEVVT